MKYQTLSVRVHFSHEQLADLLDSAGQGSQYWSQNELQFESTVNKVLDGGMTVIYDHEDTINGMPQNYFLSLVRIKKGLTVMAKKYPQHFADLLSENSDMVTGDVFLQCCIFNEVRYS